MEKKERGTVKWFSAGKGYGFLSREDNTDVFVHYSSINCEGFKTLEEGANVEFTIEKGEKGLQATNVEVL